MKAFLAFGAILLFPACSYAQAAKPCEELKTEIAAKLDAKGVKGYSLEIVAKDQNAAEGKVVGTCDGSTKKILYRKGSSPASTTDRSKETLKP